jgi:hypothetical protein
MLVRIDTYRHIVTGDTYKLLGKRGYYELFVSCDTESMFDTVDGDCLATEYTYILFGTEHSDGICGNRGN